MCKRRGPGEVVCVLALVVVVLLAARVSAPAGEEKDVWRDLKTLAGSWTGESTGFGMVSDVTHEWEFVMQGKFLRLRTRSVPRGDKTGEVHEDVAFVSRDTDNNRFVLRQFLSEGFVNTYDIVVEKGEKTTIRFDYRDVESAGGMRAQMRMVFAGPDEYEMVLDLAGPGKEFAPCQQMRMTRVD